MKVGYPSEKVREAYATLSELGDLGFLKFVSTAVLTDVAKDVLVELHLYVADALSLATGIVNSSDLLTEDSHLLKQEVKQFMEKNGFKIICLREAYGG